MSLRKLRWLIGAFLRRNRRTSLSVIVVLIALGTLIRYSTNQGLDGIVLGAISQQKYVEGVIGSPKNIDPLFATSDSEKSLQSLLFRGLTKSDAAGNILPDLASSWSVSSSGQEYIFNLNPGQKFSSGESVTADDVVFTYQSARDPKNSSSLVETFKNVQVQALDRDTILFRLSEPFSPFLALTSLGILSKDVVTKQTDKGVALRDINLAGTVNTDFRIESISQDTAQLRKGPVSYSFKFYQTSLDLERALKLGEIAAAGFTDPVDFSGWKNLQTLSSPLYQRFVAIFYNERSEPTSEKPLRQALSYALNESSIINGALRGAGEPAFSSIPPVSWAKSESLRHYNYNPTQAKTLLDGSGWSGGPVRGKNGKLLQITLSFDDTPQIRQVAEQIAIDWGAVGVRAILDPLTADDFHQKVVIGKDFQAAIVTQEVGTDPDQYSLWHTTQVKNFNLSGVSLPKMDKALEDGRQLTKIEDRTQKYLDFQRFLLDEAPVSFLYYPKYSFIVSTKVQGLDLKPLGLPQDRYNGINEWIINRTFL